MSGNQSKRLYYFLRACDAIDDLRHGQIKLSVFGKVNDKQELEACCFPGYEHNHQALVDWAKLTLRFLCLAPEPSSRHMWERYAEDGTGMCFGLDLKPDELYPVNYRPVGEPKLIGLPSDLAETLKQSDEKHREELALTYTRKLIDVCTTKFDEFSEEREERAFFNASMWEVRNGHAFVKFNQEDLVLKEVVLGKNCQLSEESVLTLVKDYPGQPAAVRRFD